MKGVRARPLKSPPRKWSPQPPRLKVGVFFFLMVPPMSPPLSMAAICSGTKSVTSPAPGFPPPPPEETTPVPPVNLGAPPSRTDPLFPVLSRRPEVSPPAPMKSGPSLFPLEGPPRRTIGRAPLPFHFPRCKRRTPRRSARSLFRRPYMSLFSPPVGEDPRGPLRPPR